MRLSTHVPTHQMLLDASASNETKVNATRTARLRAMRRRLMCTGRRQHDAALEHRDELFGELPLRESAEI